MIVRDYMRENLENAMTTKGSCGFSVNHFGSGKDHVHWLTLFLSNIHNAISSNQAHVDDMMT